MLKIRIPVSQVDKYKSFCKSFSRNLEAGTGIRLRGNMLLNAIARAAGHEGHTALLMDAGVYGNGPFRSELLPHQLAAPLAAQLELQPIQVQLMLSDAICKTAQHNPLAGVTPALLPLPDSESVVWGDMSRSYIRSLAKTGQVAFCKTDTSDLVGAGDEVVRAVFANANISLFVNQSDSNADASYPVFLSDSGLSTDDEQLLAANLNQSRPGSLLMSMTESELGKLVLNEVRNAITDQPNNDAIRVNQIMLEDEAPMTLVGPTLRQVLNNGEGKYRLTTGKIMGVTVEQKALLDSMNILQLCGAERFNACIEDNQDCDVAPKLMKQLSDLGLVQHQGEGDYLQTDLMIELKDEIKSRAAGFDLNATES